MGKHEIDYLAQLTAYRALLDTSVLCAYRSDGKLAAQAALFQAGFDSWTSWLTDALHYTDNPYARAVCNGTPPPHLAAAAQTDLTLLGSIFGDVPSLTELTTWHQINGCGPFARYRAFRWDGDGLNPIAHPDTAKEEELIGYHRQRQEVTANTRALVEGRPYLNVLLYGDSGTGKSATVKHQLTVAGLERLRAVELDKAALPQLPRLIRILREEPFPFILFIDDLAFDHDDRAYSALKTILEGGLERRPDNVAVYATSNRRNLVRQTISERAGDDVDRLETIAEKTALAERFGLRLSFSGLSKNDYLDVVEHLADFAGIEMERGLLHNAAMLFERRHPGKTPRTARQFVDSLRV